MTLDDLDELAALRSIVEGTATETGESFFSSLVTNLSRTMGTMGAWIAVYSEQKRELVAISMKMRDQWLDGFSYPVEGTPCQTALEERRTLHIPDRIVDFYRGDPSLRQYGAVSYMGVPLQDVDGTIIGQLAVLDDKPMPAEPRGAAIFQIFANRAAAELRRLRAERATREREAQLSLLLASAMDAVVVLDEDLRIVLVNSAAARVFELEEASCPGRDFGDLVDDESAGLLRKQAAALVDPSGKDQSSWIAGGLLARSARGRPFHAEATLSHYRAGGRAYFTLILRDVEDRIAAEERIRSLTRETELLRRELGSPRTFDSILGSSPALLDSLAQVGNVAATDATVLLLGETGTGKELFAEAIHAGSKRAGRPMVRVNCGAIPANLIESELFGHEKGAFTGAIQRRDGRFTLADGGTLFLDEIGELPLELQPKLLRVLQTGELEPVGSAKTMKVDVRIIAATHRDLRESVKRGTFREDLFYRLDVFPITIPPLRERRDDISVLAQAFADKFAKKLGRRLAPLSAPVLERLKAYPWPGNVRELENVVERGVILSTRGVFEIDRALPSVAPASDARSESAPPLPDRILTAGELLELERANILRALEAAGWKVAGASGAAALLGMNASTLSSRMRALGVRRPAKA